MRNLCEKVFHLSERNTNFKTELIGGLITFAAMIYILPVNSSILSKMGMSQSGVFVSTALVTCLCCLIMGLVANFPLALSAGMGMNAYVAYTVSMSMGYSWQECMMLLTVTGLIFFIFTFTPFRQKIVEAIPKGLRGAISIGLGGFILFVGLQGSHIISDSSGTLVTLGKFSEPRVLLAFVGILLTIGLMASKNKNVAKLAVPIGLLGTAFVGVVASSIMYYTGNEQAAFDSGLPIAPWLDGSLTWGANGLKDIIFYGAIGSEPESFDDIFKNVFTNPQSYAAIFTLIFVNLFDTTATLVTVGRDCGFMNEKGKMINAKKAMVADSVGALICGPFGTSTVTSFAESSIGISMGARTGLSACVTAVLFLIAGFAFPIFSIFTYESVYAVALCSVGLLIMYNGLQEVIKGDFVTAFASVLTFVMMILTYSLSNGLGIGIIAYIIMRLFEGKHKQVSITMYVIAALFIIEFVLTSLVG